MDARSAAASAASLARIAGLDADGRRTLTEAARAAMWKRDLDAVDPDRTLAPAERERRALLHRKQRLAALALASARARRDRRVQADYQRTMELLDAAGLRLEDICALCPCTCGGRAVAA